MTVDAIDEPSIEAGRLLIESEISLISIGTEREALRAAPRFPYYPGYSLVGRVIAVGEGVS